MFAGMSCFEVYGHPDLGRQLCCKIMKSESRQETYDPRRDSLACLCKRPVCSGIAFCRRVESSADALELAGIHKSGQVATGNPKSGQIAGSDNAFFPDEPHKSLGGCAFHECIFCYILSVDIDIYRRFVTFGPPRVK